VASALEGARRKGARAAQHEYLRRAIPLDRRIDIFRIVQESGIWLMFQPLGGLFGAYQRLGEAAGIVLNTKHLPAVQRFTAAHEFGHHVLGHERSFDTEDEIEPGPGGSDSEDEAAAQAFAADFLMPLPLINRTLKDMGLALSPATLSADQVYQLSLDLGASYSATISRLVGLNKLSFNAAGDLRKQRPIAIKEERAGRRPDWTRAQVWLLNEKWQEGVLRPWVGDEIHVVLPGTPSSGYLWVLKEPERDALEPAGQGLIVLEKEAFEPTGQQEMFGAEGAQHLVFRVTKPGFQSLRLTKQRPWQADLAPLATFEAKVEAEAFPTGDSRRGLSEPQKELLLVS
jgi:Zn-dependent peptidase ImmA (M78 family)/predicted secreted protein